MLFIEHDKYTLTSSDLIKIAFSAKVSRRYVSYLIREGRTPQKNQTEKEIAVFAAAKTVSDSNKVIAKRLNLAL